MQILMLHIQILSKNMTLTQASGFSVVMLEKTRELYNTPRSKKVKAYNVYAESLEVSHPNTFSLY